MSASAMRRGACPSLPEPMATGDGLLARIALAAPLSPDQLEGLARLGASLGNGIVEVSARGNLQVRGLSAASARALAEGVGALGIAVREGLAIETNPLAGRDPGAALDPRPIAEEIARRALPLAGRLAPKVVVIVDGGGVLHLDGLAADIRLAALDADRLALEAGGAPLAVVGRHVAAEAVSRLLATLAARGPTARMASLVQNSRPHPAVRAKRASKDEVVNESFHQRPPAEPVGTHSLANGRLALGIGLAFGQTDAASLVRLAGLGRDAGASGIGTCFGRVLLIIGLPGAGADTVRREAAALGFITDPTDPRRSVSACPGRPACASGRIETRALAAELAPLTGGRSLHVSGCAKGCAHPRRADLTIVGLDGGAGLVVEGGPRDAPQVVVPETELRTAARRILERHGG